MTTTRAWSWTWTSPSTQPLHTVQHQQQSNKRIRDHEHRIGLRGWQYHVYDDLLLVISCEFLAPKRFKFTEVLLIGLHRESLHTTRATLLINKIMWLNTLDTSMTMNSLPKEICWNPGKSVCIQSRVNPNDFWYCPRQKHRRVTAGTSIYTSTVNRTLFQLAAIPTLEYQTNISSSLVSIEHQTRANSIQLDQIRGLDYCVVQRIQILESYRRNSR
ncbi:hypothetical protein BJ138DRAFT_652478 [Hygrophoropsis aurantiaca]|uniref:Uncharacterized protein n=1 Tax=Hygrophoropsis aurantiaca TaxID=72124 RepID=A0ACB8A0X0_9AGAM|nr:hypothetical protein BJ138DRAFT_652478 [Hygrophoropsis aurantiaca]